MKFKNYKSAIHNFAHSFQSIDIVKSPKYAINILIELRNKGIEASATFNFANQTIVPKEANTGSAISLLKHYSEWLPNHFSNHNCDLDRITILEITISEDFENMNSPLRMNDTKELMVETTTKWKAKDKEEQMVTISRKELIRTTYIRNGIPEIK